MGDRPDPSRLDGDGPALADAPGLLSRLLIQLAQAPETEREGAWWQALQAGELVGRYRTGAEAVRVADEMAQGLAHAHSRGETPDERADADLPLLAEAQALQARLAARYRVRSPRPRRRPPSTI